MLVCSACSNKNGLYYAPVTEWYFREDKDGNEVLVELGRCPQCGKGCSTKKITSLTGLTGKLLIDVT